MKVTKDGFHSNLHTGRMDTDQYVDFGIFEQYFHCFEKFSNPAGLHIIVVRVNFCTLYSKYVLLQTKYYIMISRSNSGMYSLLPDREDNVIDLKVLKLFQHPILKFC